MSDFESDSDDVDESQHVPRPLGNSKVRSCDILHPSVAQYLPQDDEMVEYTDEYGRTRTAPRSEVPVEDDEDPVVEYEDEFGRMRTARRSDVPRHLLPKAGDDDIDSDEYVNAFPRHDQC